MKTLLNATVTLTLTLTLASCGANNGSDTAKSLNNKTVTPSTNIQIADNGSQVVVTTEPEVVSTQPAIEEAVSTVTVPASAGPVLVQIISPTEITETIVNVDPAQPDLIPETIVEVIVEETKPVIVDDVPAEVVSVVEAPVYENIVQRDPVVEVVEVVEVIEETPSAPAVDVIDTTLVKQVEDLLKSSKPDAKELKNLKSSILKRIKVVENLLDVHQKHKNMNEKKVAEWTAELAILKASLASIEKWESLKK